MTYSYEWTWEVEDASGDIISQGFYPTLRECLREADSPNAHFALMWREGNDDDGELDRAYAYCERSAGRYILPEFFDNGWHKVPQRFHKETLRIEEDA